MQTNVWNWKKVLAEEVGKSYYQDIVQQLQLERQKGNTIFPPEKDVFNAYKLTPFHNIKVVILGQDPYHNFGQAHGLSFSVQQGISPPPSLKNIFTELKSDVNIATPSHGNLTCWATQGVLLLNSILTVRANEPASHSKLAWQQLTDATINLISFHLEHIVFMLWGNYAQSKRALIDTQKHLILEAPHPSPFSVHRGFYGCKHFSKANDYLISKGKTHIDWNVV